MRDWLQRRVGIGGRLIACEDPTVGVLCMGFMLVVAVVHLLGWIATALR